jgi:2'-phosphotransferase
VVETSDKRRFKLEERRASEFYPDCRGMEHDRWILCIRANQGHSIEGILDPNLLLTQLSPTELVAVPMIVHGTYEAAWDNNIQTHGLSCMGRNHIHFATGLPTPRKRGEGSTKDTALDVSTSRQSVTSGIRRSCQIYIYIDAKKCVRDGIVFYRSDNGVLLTNGINGTLPVACFSHVTTASGSILLDQREKPRSGNHI